MTPCHCPSLFFGLGVRELEQDDTGAYGEKDLQTRQVEAASSVTWEVQESQPHQNVQGIFFLQYTLIARMLWYSDVVIPLQRLGPKSIQLSSANAAMPTGHELRPAVKEE